MLIAVRQRAPETLPQLFKQHRTPPRVASIKSDAAARPRASLLCVSSAGRCEAPLGKNQSRQPLLTRAGELALSLVWLEGTLEPRPECTKFARLEAPPWRVSAIVQRRAVLSRAPKVTDTPDSFAAVARWLLLSCYSWLLLAGCC